ncbi:hypothetical protein LSH36_165g01012 [Paralvinella palmiformis]|uniref:Uncharacterized protein n=1 Tax=Paralvinella palmiformis TaxID=53620 RepID=A0AAD9JTK4_9ANNE|nr:hypothetical protein LSH36_165g01012 [Paralvinella palmiformis]
MCALKWSPSSTAATDNVIRWSRARFHRKCAGCGCRTFEEFYRRCMAREADLTSCDVDTFHVEPKPATDTRAPWQKAEDVDGSTDEGFDEDAYLRGKIPILRDSVPRELPPRDVNKPKTYRERAPWERADDDDKPVDADKEFDEDKYLAGRADICVRKSVDRDLTSPARSEDQFSKIPSRTFHYLRRSMSREGSPSSSISSGRPPSRQSSYDSQDEDEEPDPNKPYNEMVYVGKKIPSKAFLRLEKSMNRKAKRQAVGKIRRFYITTREISENCFSRLDDDGGGGDDDDDDDDDYDDDDGDDDDDDDMVCLAPLSS